MIYCHRCCLEEDTTRSLQALRPPLTMMRKCVLAVHYCVSDSSSTSIYTRVLIVSGCPAVSRKVKTNISFGLKDEDVRRW